MSAEHSDDTGRWLTVAFHELGHAVVAELLGRPIIRVFLGQADGTGPIAGTEFPPRSVADALALSQEDLMRDARIWIAGGFARFLPWRTDFLCKVERFCAGELGANGLVVTGIGDTLR